MGKKNTNKKILIIPGDDKRERYRFISDPLSLNDNVEVSIIREKKIYKSIKKTFSFINQKSFDLIIFAHIDILHAFLIPIARYRKLKCVIRFGGDLYEDLKNKIAIARNEKNYLKIIVYFLIFSIRIILINFADGYIVVNPFLKEKMNKYIFFERKNIFVVPQYVKEIDIVTLNRVFKKSRLNLLSVSNLNNWEKVISIKKIIEYLIKFNKFNSHIKCYKIAGGGAHLKHLQNWLKQNNSSGLEIKLLGQQSKKSLYELYEKSDIFLYASLNDYLPNVLLEAQAFGLPIVINNYRPLTEMLSEKTNALYFDINDQEEFIYDLSKLLTNEKLRELIGTNNYNDVRRKYSLEVIASQLNRTFDEMLDLD